ncbi:MAG: methyltransferase domain-containing protein [Planctomycetota bacterium]
MTTSKVQTEPDSRENETAHASSHRPWQLRMLDVSLKKKQKLNALLRHLGSTSGRCLLVTCGDNNGSLNYRIRETGGNWTFCDLEPQNVAEMSELLGQEVAHVPNPAVLRYADGEFDTIVTIDCQEHLADPRPFNKEIARLLKPGGRAILTVPNGNEKKLAVRLKNLVGMSKESYGHHVVGYDVPEMEAQAREAGLEPTANSSYSRTFTELIELCINLMYVKVLSRKKSGHGPIAPASSRDLEKIEKIYRVYRLAYPVLRALSTLDVLVPFGRGYAVVVESRKPA